MKVLGLFCLSEYFSNADTARYRSFQLFCCFGAIGMSNLIGGIGETLLWSVHICIYSKTTPKKKGDSLQFVQTVSSCNNFFRNILFLNRRCRWMRGTWAKRCSQMPWKNIEVFSARVLKLLLLLLMLRSGIHSSDDQRETSTLCLYSIPLFSLAYQCIVLLLLLFFDHI